MTEHNREEHCGLESVEGCKRWFRPLTELLVGETPKAVGENTPWPIRSISESQPCVREVLLGLAERELAMPGSERLRHPICEI